MNRLLLALLLAISGTEILTNEDILALVKAGLSADVIISKISTSTPAFHTEVRDLVALHAAHVDDRIVQAMVHAGTSTTAPTPAATTDAGLPPVRFGGILIDLPGIRTYEGTLTVDPAGLTYEAPGFGTIHTAWTGVESVCFEAGFYGSLFVRVRGRYTGTASVKVGRVVLLKCAPSVLRPAYEYLKRMHQGVAEDCSDKGKDV